MTKILSWNVNGVRAALKKGFLDWIQKESPDVICLQEIKAQVHQLPPELLQIPGYESHWNPAMRPGYSGVALITRKKPLSVFKGFGVSRFDDEGRVIGAEFPEFTLINIYFPNGQSNADRLQYKLDFYDESLKFFKALQKKGKKLVVCGDYNTAHHPIDLAHPKENEKTSGFLAIERAWLDQLCSHGFLDTFRIFNDKPDQYSWWDLRTRSRERNVGWRIDYHFVSGDLKSSLKDAFIQPHVTGSDHCPVGLLLNF